MEIDLSTIYSEVRQQASFNGNNQKVVSSPTSEIMYLVEQACQNAYDEGFAKGLDNTENIYWNRPLDKEKLIFKWS